MSRITITNKLTSEFGMVPNALWSSSLPRDAKLCFAYLCCQRQGAMPYVAQIEAETGLGRDARRKAFAALEAEGLIEWRIERDPRSNRIVAKTLLVDPLAVRSLAQAPENQAHGAQASEMVHAPEKPADGSAVPAETEKAPLTACGSGDIPKQKKQRVARARDAVRHKPEPHRLPRDRGGAAPASQLLDSLTAFQRTQLREGKAILLPSREFCRPGSGLFEAMAQIVRDADRCARS